MSFLQHQIPLHASFLNIQSPVQQSCSEPPKTASQLLTQNFPGGASQIPIITAQSLLRDATTAPRSPEVPLQQRSTKRKLPADFEYENRSAPRIMRGDPQSQNEDVKRRRGRPGRTAPASTVSTIPVPEASSRNRSSLEFTPTVPKSTPFEFTFTCPATTLHPSPHNLHIISSPNTQCLPATGPPSVSQYQPSQSDWDDSVGFNVNQENGPDVSVLKDWLFSRGNQLELLRLQEIARQAQIARNQGFPAGDDHPPPRAISIPIMSSLTGSPGSNSVKESPKLSIPPSPPLLHLPGEATVCPPCMVVDYELYLDLAHEFEPSALPLTPFDPEYCPEVLTNDEFLSLILDL